MKSNQRSTYRCRTIEPSQRAVLKVGRKQVVVELLDESMGGFAVQSLDRIRVKFGQVLKLRTRVGWSVVEVIHIARLGSRSRIGLRRLDDLPDPRLTAALHRNSFPGARAGRKLQSTEGFLSQALGIGLVVIVGFWIAATHSIWRPKVSEWFRSQPWLAVVHFGTGSATVTNETIPGEGATSTETASP